MSGIALNLPWDSQPQEAVGVDWSDPLNAGLQAFWLPQQVGYFDVTLRAGNANTRTGAPTLVGSNRQISGYKFASGQYFAGSSALAVPSAELSIAFWLNMPASSGAYEMILTRDVGGGTNAWEIARDLFGGSALRVYISSGGGVNHSMSGLVSANEWHLFHYSRGATDGIWYVNGVFDNTTTAINISATGAIGINNRAGSFTGTHAIGPVRIWNRETSAEEAIRLYLEPLVGIAPRQIWIPASGSISPVPTLSLPTAINITASSFQPRVSYAF